MGGLVVFRTCRYFCCWPISDMGQSLPMHSAPVSNNVRFAPIATVTHPGTD